MTTINSNNGDGETSPVHEINGQKAEDDRKLFVGKEQSSPSLNSFFFHDARYSI